MLTPCFPSAFLYGGGMDRMKNRKSGSNFQYISSPTEQRFFSAIHIAVTPSAMYHVSLVLALVGDIKQRLMM